MARRPQIAVIGAGAAEETLLSTARALGEALVDAGFRVVCGGLGGVMTAAAQGARRSAAATGADVIGLLPTLQAGHANPYVDIVIPTGLSLARNLLVVASADVVVAVGGGSGTLSEIALAWQLGKPIVALSQTGGWAGRLAGQAVDDRRADKVVDVSSVSEAIAAIQQALAHPAAPRS